MHKQEDTRLRFVETLSELMESRPLEKVKVSHLCEAMGVSRATFYEYFRDIFGVPTWFWDHLMQQSLYRTGIDQGCLDAHLHKFELLRQHQDFFVRAFKCIDYNSVCEYGGRSVKKHMVETAQANARRAFTKQELLEVEFFVTGAQYMTRTWVRGGMTESPKCMAELFCKFAPDFLVRYLEPRER